jgi:macrolide-specific efflux system membrane fusion protein
VRVVEPDGTLQHREVVVGVSNRVSAAVLSGLQPGDTVVVGRKAAAEDPSSNPSDREHTRRFGGGLGGLH